MSFSSSGGRREAADIKIDPCQHAAIVDTTRDIDNCGRCEDQQTRTHVSGETEKMEGEEGVREFAGLCAFTSHFLVSSVSWRESRETVGL